MMQTQQSSALVLMMNTNSTAGSDGASGGDRVDRSDQYSPPVFGTKRWIAERLRWINKRSEASSKQSDEEEESSGR
jgi:hypothetical protein